MKEHIAHSGAWGIALIVIVLISWFLYRYLAPKTWREWAGAGVIQAFIVALYAEMYGFPLTIYLLVRFFGLDRTYLNANLWSTLLGFGELGMMISMILGYLILFVGIGIFMEGWRELHRARQENRLVTNRLYGLVRHPQYTGLFISLFGEGIVHWPTIFSIALYPIIILVYVLLARSEESRMLAQFGEEYRIYRHRVPGFIPRWGQWRNLVAMRNDTSDESNQTPNEKTDEKNPDSKDDDSQ
ncbi:MAG: isoprenylcysteine carboxylmethyltransferase family protein [Geobacteraceae bacterium]